MVHLTPIGLRAKERNLIGNRIRFRSLGVFWSSKDMWIQLRITEDNPLPPNSVFCEQRKEGTMRNVLSYFFWTAFSGHQCEIVKTLYFNRGCLQLNTGPEVLIAQSGGPQKPIRQQRQWIETLLVQNVSVFMIVGAVMSSVASIHFFLSLLVERNERWRKASSDD